LPLTTAKTLPHGQGLLESYSVLQVVLFRLDQITQYSFPRAQSYDHSVGVGAVFTLPKQCSQVGGQVQRHATIQAK
jgi:hypothetical protein